MKRLLLQFRDYLVQDLDLPLFYCFCVVLCLGFLVVYSATYSNPGRFHDHLRNAGIAVAVLWIGARIPPSVYLRLSWVLYALALLLLVMVALWGSTRKGARRWLPLGLLTIQPSELMKILVPLVLAWYFHQREGIIRWWNYGLAFILVLLPTMLIIKQPDLGTAILVMGGGCYVIFFAGLPLSLVIPAIIIGILGVGGLLYWGGDLCQPDINWFGLREYQKQRICTLLDPTIDPRGKGFHAMQSAIAVGSGGWLGKGWLMGTQSHLEFIPERHTDFIFAVYAEEFGLLGALFLLTAYLCLIGRGLFLATTARTVFARLVTGAISLLLFTYVFVNLGMVTGILPVVGIPLPYISYGGTAMVSLSFGLGLIMSLQRDGKL